MRLNEMRAQQTVIQIFGIGIFSLRKHLTASSGSTLMLATLQPQESLRKLMYLTTSSCSLRSAIQSLGCWISVCTPHDSFMSPLSHYSLSSAPLAPSCPLDQRTHCSPLYSTKSPREISNGQSSTSSRAWRSSSRLSPLHTGLTCQRIMRKIRHG